MLRFSRPAALALLALGAAAHTAHAQTVFTGTDDPRGARTNSIAARTLFLAALTSSGTDTIEAFAEGTPDPTLVFGATGLTATTDVDRVFTDPFVATSGSNFLLDRFGDDTFTLSAPVTAFGLDLINPGDAMGPTIVTLRLTNTAAMTSKDVSFLFNTRTSGNNVLFFGVTDTDPFNRVTFLNSQDATDAVGFDDVTAGFVRPAQQVIPEPGTLALAGMGLLPLAGAVARKRRRSN